MMLLLLSLITVLVLLPGDAFAWGGGTHLQIGLSVLSSLSALPEALATILESCPYDYLYGCLAPDITIAKKYTDYQSHCHRWQAGERLLAMARNDRERACAYGYLSHLAADLVAHNVYVPYKTIRSFSAMALRHTYWELRFESFVDGDIWQLARQACAVGRCHDDVLLRAVLVPTLLPFGANKRIFSSLLILARIRRWQAMLSTVANHSSHHLSAIDRADYLQMSTDAVMDLLTVGDSSWCFTADPTGEVALATSKVMRRHLRFLYQTRRITKEEGMERVAFLKPMLIRGMRDPGLHTVLRQACTERHSPFLE